jgi:hypothetical protein
MPDDGWFICGLSRRLVRHSSGNKGRRRKALRRRIALSFLRVHSRLLFASIHGLSVIRVHSWSFFAFFPLSCGYYLLPDETIASNCFHQCSAGAEHSTKMDRPLGVRTFSFDRDSYLELRADHAQLCHTDWRN